MKLLLFGSTGLVGQEVLALALADPRVSAVVTPVRRAVPARGKLVAPVVDFGRLPEAAAWWQAGAAICALGTTLRAAGSREAFRTVDRDYVLAVARLARRHGTPAFVLGSSMGADPGSRVFYTRVKGEAEQAVAGLGFPSLTILRPGLIGGTRRERRPAEWLTGLVLSRLAPVLPRGLRVNPAARIAQAMLEAALEAAPGERIIPSSALA